VTIAARARRFNRLSLLVDGNWVRAKERPTFEIDSRALRREAALGWGATLTANVSYEAWPSSLITVEGMRDVEYSFEDAQPYYLLNGLTGTLTQRVFGPLDVQGRAGLRSLDYRNRMNVPGLPPERRDHVTVLGAGLGYNLGRDMRFAIDTEHHRRTSAIADRRFSGARYGVTITYDL
jgi:hypothetical protein